MSYSAIIFDFDGVIADSEVHSNQSLAEFLTSEGLPTTFEDSLRDYCGSNWQEVQRIVAERLGTALPDRFRERYQDHARVSMTSGLEPVPGAADFIASLGTKPKAIASSSPSDYIVWALSRFELVGHFGTHIYSADGWELGKPYPDIYLAAALGLGIEPTKCLAIEDFPTGAKSALAAGMGVIGLCAASHILDPAEHAEKLRAIGVQQIAYSFDQIGGV